MKRLLILLIFIASCTGPINNGDGAYTPEEIIGRDGVILQTLHQPSEVYEQEDFSITFLLQNVGANQIGLASPGWLSVNVDPLYLDFLSLDSALSPEGDAQFRRRKGTAYVPFILDRRYWYADGEETFVTVQAQAKKLQRFSERVATKVTLNACYPYATNLTQDVCIETDFYEDQGAIVCTNAPLRPPPQAAPVVVKEVQVRNLRRIPDDATNENPGVVVPTFNIVVEHVGDGSPGLGQCVSLAEDGTVNSPTDRKLGMIMLQAQLLTTELQCGQAEAGEAVEVRLIDGVGSILCRVPESTDEGLKFALGQGNFISLLSVQLEYVYRDSITTEIHIAHE